MTNPLGHGVRSSLRMLRSTPGLSGLAVATLALGIGFTTTMFGIVHGATRPLPVAEPEAVVAVRKVASRGAGPGDLETRAFDLDTWRASRLMSVAAFQMASVNVAGEGAAPQRVAAAWITTDGFDVLGWAASLGRGFTASDTVPGAAPVVLLSDDLWRGRYGSDPQMVGRTIRVDGRRHEVIGVMPPRVGFPVSARLWIPLALPTVPRPGDGPSITVFGRLAGSVRVEAARHELDTLTAREAARMPDLLGGVGVEVLPFTELELPREIVLGLRLLLVAVGFVLLIACGNVAALLSFRGAVRARDVATRLALGASRGQLVIEHVCEALTLAVLGAVLGIAIAAAGLRVFGLYTAGIIDAFWVDFRVDPAVAVCAALLAVMSTLAAGLGPALQAARASISDTLRDAGPGSTSLRMGRLTRRLPAFQIALASGLLALTVVLGRAALHLRALEWPFDETRVLSAEYGLPVATLGNQDARNRMFRELESALATEPGVRAAGLISALPGRGGGSWDVSLDRPVVPGASAPYRTNLAMASPGFFDVVGASALVGRLFTPNDDERAAPVALANASFAARVSPDRSPVGRLAFIGDRAFTIVGVVPDLMAGDIQDVTQDGLYVPILQMRPFAVRVVAAGWADPLALGGALRRATAKVDPDLPVFDVLPLRDAALNDKAVLEVLGGLFLLFGVGALGLAAVGLYGVVAFGVTRRTREIAVRMALGASRADVARVIAAEGLTHLISGLAAGLALAVVLTRGFAVAIAGAPQADGRVLVVVVGSVALTTIVALLVPTARAVRTPMIGALRQE